MVRKGVDLEVRDSEGSIFFYLVFVFSDVFVVCMFLEYGVSVNLKDFEGGIFLYIVVVFGKVEIV